MRFIFAAMMVFLCAALSACSVRGNQQVNTDILLRSAENRKAGSTLSEHMKFLSEALRSTNVEYPLGPGDVLKISIFGFEKPGEPMERSYRVSRAGIIRLPIIGTVEASGRTAEQLQTDIEERIRANLMQNPIVSVFVAEYASRKVAVMGAVSKPGIFNLDKPGISLMEALSMAGGVNDKAGYELYVVKQGVDAPAVQSGPAPSAGGPAPSAGGPAPGAGEPVSGTAAVSAVIILGPTGPVAQRIDLNELLKKGRLDLNVWLGNGDAIFVPEAEKAYVVGHVKKPGEVLLKAPMRVLDAVSAAGGIDNEKCTPENTFIRRKTGDTEIVIPIDLVDVAAGKVADVDVQPGDVIEVPQSTVNFLVWQTLDLAKTMINVTAYNLNRP
jgi:polysaccharide biosynthesis/export protein